MSGEPTVGTPPAPAAPAAPAPAAPAAWHSTFQGDDKGWIENRGLHTKDAPTAIAELVKGFRSAEGFLGVPKDRLLRLPESTTDLTKMGEVFDRLGRPVKPEEYKFPAPKGADGTPQPLEEGFTKWAQGTFHQAGVTQAQAEAILGSWLNDYVTPAAAAEQEAFKTTLANDTAALQKEWGAAFEQNQKIARAAAGALEIDEGTFDELAQVLGPAKAAKLFHKIGSKVMEPDFVSAVSNKTTNPVRTPEAAKQRIKELEADGGFRKKYLDGDTEARAEMQRLHREANPT